ncbi:hypothetical protein [Puniceibacterium sediminis]|uniref:hypothetical protein n=1 Tax=Puniceibacterium sediminis TaxID=1608407 RepID=UPI00113214E8|nr:hypothetical protein [Puniceibacterium sediminis]
MTISRPTIEHLKGITQGLRITVATKEGGIGLVNERPQPMTSAPALTATLVCRLAGIWQQSPWILPRRRHRAGA